MDKLKLILATALLPALALAAITPVSLKWMNPKTPGSYYSVGSMKGVTVVEAYFLNCIFCNRNAPQVNDLAGKYANEPRVEVLDVGIDSSDADYATWIRRHNPNHPVLKDNTQLLIKQFGTRKYPSTYVVDCRGQVLFRSMGVWSTDIKRQIDDAIRVGLQTTCE